MNTKNADNLFNNFDISTMDFNLVMNLLSNESCLLISRMVSYFKVYVGWQPLILDDQDCCSIVLRNNVWTSVVMSGHKLFAGCDVEMLDKGAS